MYRGAFAFIVCALTATTVPAADDAPLKTPGAEEDVQVTATRFVEDPTNLPTVVTVIDGATLRERGITDLRSALGVVAGVDIAPGGDGGPASAVPEMWGLREADAFLLVVDGVPWGGAFNPDMPAISLRDVERIEVLRGSAPVMFGATSFVGVIHIIHNQAGSHQGEAQAIVGDHRSVGVSGAIDLAAAKSFSSRVAVDFMQQGYPDERTDWERAHLLWRNLIPAWGGHIRFDVDTLNLKQSPSSPAFRVGDALSPVPGEDDNVNPLGSHIDPRKHTVTAGYDYVTGFGSWNTTLSYSHVDTDILRGFLDADPVFPTTPGHGFRQVIVEDQLYFDAHVDITKAPKLDIVTGIDVNYGRGRMRGGDFDYDVAPDGSDVPNGNDIPNAADVSIRDNRTFTGAYGYAAWTPAPRWRVDAGVRLNYVDERRDIYAVEFGPPDVVDAGNDATTETKVSGSVGGTFTAWMQGENNAKVFANYRNTFKPAAIDFGLDADVDILEPETGNSYEIGARTALLDKRLNIEVEAFQMDLDNIIVAEEGTPTPGIENGGEQRLRGVELEVHGRMKDSLYGRFAWSYHDSKFKDFTQDFGAGPVQLAGNRLEMVPENLGALGVIWAPKSGLTAHGEVRYTGSRYLNRRNTALASSFTTWSAGVGWRHKNMEARLDGENLSDRRDPVSESELGEGQYYRLPARQIWLSCNWVF